MKPEQTEEEIALAQFAEAQRSKNEEVSAEETYTEDNENLANNLRRRLWRIADCLSYIPQDLAEQVGGILWRLSTEDRDQGAAIWFKWLKQQGVHDRGRRWAQCEGSQYMRVEELYRVAQKAGWRYPIAQNLNRLD